MAAPTNPQTSILRERGFYPVSFFQPHIGICWFPLGPTPMAPETTHIFLGPMLRAQIGQSVVLKTPTKLQHPYCKSFGAIAIGKLHLALLIRNVSLSRKFETSRKSTPTWTRRYLHSTSRPMLYHVYHGKYINMNVLAEGKRRNSKQ